FPRRVRLPIRYYQGCVGAPKSVAASDCPVDASQSRARPERTRPRVAVILFGLQVLFAGSRRPTELRMAGRVSDNPARRLPESPVGQKSQEEQTQHSFPRGSSV